MTLLDKARQYLAEENAAYGREVETTMPEVLHWMAAFAESVIPKWTYCEDAMPPEDTLVIVTQGKKSYVGMWLGRFDGWWIRGKGSGQKRVIAWMPLPDPATLAPLKAVTAERQGEIMDNTTNIYGVTRKAKEKPSAPRLRSRKAFVFTLGFKRNRKVEPSERSFVLVAR